MTTPLNTKIMTQEEREKQIEDAGIEYTIANKPRCIAGDNFADLARQFNKNKDFEAGAKWSDRNPLNYDGKALLYATDKAFKNGYKLAIEEACEWLEKNTTKYCGFDAISEEFSMAWNFIDDFKKALAWDATRVLKVDELNRSVTNAMANVAKDLSENSKPMPPECQEIVNDHFWDLVEEQTDND